MPHPLLISVHIPKTGGTSFGAMLQRHFGPRLLRDYDDRPLSHGVVRRLRDAVVGSHRARGRLDGHDAVHGHFLALKYRSVPGDMVTWLRDPAQRIVSRYGHYQRDVAEGVPLQRVRGLRPGLSLEEFIEIPRFQNTYAKYLHWVPLSRLRCVGFSEDMEEGLARMRRVLGLDLGDAVSLRANPERGADPYDVPPAIARRIARLNAADYRLWHRAREREGV